jgi:molybdopterin synthase catalytic subunit
LTALIHIAVQTEDFNPADEALRLQQGRGDVGALVQFTGYCRDEGGTLSALELEHYPGMAEAEMTRIAREAATRFSLIGLSAIHRYGKILPGEQIVLVSAAAPHRQAAFDGANYVMDFLKTAAPFWKKEHLPDGSTGEWVSAKDADDRAREKWTGEPQAVGQRTEK